MKSTFSIFLFFCLNSYILSAQNADAKASNLADEWLVAGSKTLNASKTEESSIFCNVCPTLNFERDKIVVKTPGGTEEIYSYEFKNNQITIDFLGEKESHHTFNHDSTFTLNFVNEKELLLTDSEDYSVILRR